jgi:hypothetical protein
MTVTRSGSTKKYAETWSKAFGGGKKKSAKISKASKASKAAKTSKKNVKAAKKKKSAGKRK